MKHTKININEVINSSIITDENLVMFINEIQKLRPTNYFEDEITLDFNGIESITCSLFLQLLETIFTYFDKSHVHTMNMTPSVNKIFAQLFKIGLIR